MQTQLVHRLSIFGSCAALLLMTSPGLASWYETQLTGTLAPSTDPQIIYDASDVLHVFWQEFDEICHQSLDTGLWSEVEILGQGHSLDQTTSLTDEAICLAWISADNTVRFRSCREGVWCVESTLPSFTGGAIIAVATTYQNGGCLAWAEYDPNTSDVIIFFSEETESGWSFPYPVVQVSTLYDPGFTQVRLRNLDAGGLLVSYLSDNYEPVHACARTGSTWNPPEVPFDWLAGPFDMESDPSSGIAHFAGNGPAPTCPCNVVVYLSGVPGAWEPSEQIGTGHYPAEMEWPQEISMQVAALDGAPHVVWRHESYDMLELQDERLLYGFKSEGTWNFDDTIAIGREAHGPQVAIDSNGERAIAWYDDSDGIYNIYLATSQEIADVSDSPVHPYTWLRASPNPSSEEITLIWEGNGLAPYRIDIFDVQGRHVAKLENPKREATEWHWQGRDLSGVRLPGGVYHAVARSHGANAGVTLTLIR